MPGINLRLQSRNRMAIVAWSAWSAWRAWIARSAAYFCFQAGMGVKRMGAVEGDGGGKRE
jgi:hypothetical protein